MRAKLGIIGAMEEELSLLKELMGEWSSSVVAGMEFCEGDLCGVPVTMVRCGIGKVNAAMCTQTLIDRYGVTHLINTGVAGSLDASIDIGDLVVSSDCVQHDYDVTALGYDPGIIPDQDVSHFPADRALRAMALDAAAATASEVVTREGRIASGDQFVGDGAVKARIVKLFGALCCEMEGAAIAQVAYANDVPFVVIRAISDKADGSAEQDYPTFVQAAARRSAALVSAMASRLGE